MEKSKILANVGSREITQADLDAFLKALDPRTAAQFHSGGDNKKLLEELINQELYFLDAIENGTDKDAEYIAEVKKISQNFLKQYAIFKLLNCVTIDDEEILDYYSKNKAQFKAPESIRASHILVESEDLAQKVLEKLNTGLSFEDVAKEYSDCPSNQQGGDLGYFSKGKMVPEFDAAAFAMDKEEVSSPVRTQFGYHIIKLTDKTPSHQQSFDEVKKSLSQQILALKQQKVYFSKIDELKNKYIVKIN